MIQLQQFIDLLNENHLLVSIQALQVDCEITGEPVTDSRLLRTGDVFFCIKGLQSDGHKYIKQARNIGVHFVVQEDDFSDSLPAVQVTNSRKAAALFAKLYFNNPSSKICLIGITGTNGKTTTSMLIWQALTLLGHKTGWIGTLGYRIDDEIIPTNNTTPDIIELNTIFSEMVDSGCKYIVMEVSSHALALDRVFGLEYDFALFTNLTRDHLDFHANMKDYYDSKARLFEYTLANAGQCIINIDDEYGKALHSGLSETSKEKITTISVTYGDVTILKSQSSLSGSEIELNLYENYYKLETRLVGHFNILNVVMSFTTIKKILPSLNDEMIIEAMSMLDPVKGRLEQVINNEEIGVFVDYAHTPDALKNVLDTLRKIKHKHIITVFGAGGDRDKGKRPEMLVECLKYSDVVIITDDNPRMEDPDHIIKDIISDSSIWNNWWILRNREHAISAAIRLATSNDIVLIAGKGHENYQEIKGCRHNFDDVEVARKHLTTGNKLSGDGLSIPIDKLMLEILFGKQENYNQSESQYNPVDFRFVSTDSRSIKGGSVFFALKGENFNGNDYIQTVLKDSTNVAISSEPHFKDRVYCVDDVQSALGILAKKYLQLFSPYIVALTGSTGKTTTKEYIANILSTQGMVLKTIQNENNIIGLTKTIFRIKPDDRYAVFELGTNSFGEIAQLADICNPDFAIITNIGPSHLEFLRDEDGVYKEKTALFRRTLKTFIFPSDDIRFSEFKSKGIGVGVNPDCKYQLSDVSTSESNTSFRLAGLTWTVPQIVPFYTINISFAIACALEIGLTSVDVQNGLNQPIKLQMRMDIKHFGNCYLIEDCYNANPVSMKAALKFWYDYHPQLPHIAILGDMLELGNHSESYHQGIGEILKKMRFASLITIGQYAKLYQGDHASGSDEVELTQKHFPVVSDEAIQTVLNVLPPKAVILVKASHGVHLEKIANAIEKKYSIAQTKTSCRVEE